MSPSKNNKKLIQIQPNLWINESSIVYVRRNMAGFLEVTCNPKAQTNRYNYPEDGWVLVDSPFEKYIK